MTIGAPGIVVRPERWHHNICSVEEHLIDPADSRTHIHNDEVNAVFFA